MTALELRAVEPETLIETIEIAAISRDVQVRVKTDRGTVEDYARAMLADPSAKWPAVVVYRDRKTGSLYLSDGNHRLEARIKNGETTIEAEVREGGKREALAHAMGSSKGHGLRFSNADKRKIVGLALKDPKLKRLKDQELADLIGVSQPFIWKLRQSITIIKSEPAEGEATEPSEPTAPPTVDPIDKPLAKFKALLALVPEPERARFAELVLAMLTAPSE